MHPNTEYPLDYTKGPSSQGRVGSRSSGAGIQQTAQELLNQARDYRAKAQDALQNAKPFLAKSAKEQPMTTLAALAAVGFILGALWKK